MNHRTSHPHFVVLTLLAYSIVSGQSLPTDHLASADETATAALSEPVDFIDNAPQANNAMNGANRVAPPSGWGFATFSPDGTTVATVSVVSDGERKGEVVLWNVANPKPGVRFEQSGQIQVVAFSPDGKWLAIGPNGADDGVQLVDVQTGKVEHKLPGPVAKTNAIAWSHDGSQIAVASSSDRTIRTWSVTENKVVKAVEPEVASFFSMTFTESGQPWAAGVPTIDRDALAVFDGLTGKVEKTLNGHKELIEAAAFSGDGLTLVSVGWDATVRVWDLEKGEQTAGMKGHKKGVRWVAISANKKRIATANERELKLWDGEKHEHLADLGADGSGAKFLAMSPDGSTLISITRDGAAHLWDVEKKTEKAKLDRDSTVTVAGIGSAPAAATVNDVPEADAIQSVAYSPDGKWIALAREDGRISIRNAEDGSVVREIDAFSDVASCVTFSPDSQRIAAGSFEKNAKVWDVATGDLITEFVGHTNWVFSVAFSPDGATLATAGYDKLAKIWNVDDGSELATLEGHTAGVRSVVYSTNGQRLITGSADRTAIVWNVADRSLVTTLKGHASAIRAVACSPDGSTVATASEDATVKLWKTSDWTEQATLAGTDGVMFWCLAYSPAGKTLAAGAFNGTVMLFDPSTGKDRKTLRGPTEAVTAVAFAPGAREVIAGSVDKSLHRWKADIAAPAKPKPPESVPLTPSNPIGELHSFALPTERPVSSLAFSNHGERLAVGTGLYRSAGALQVWDLNTKEKLWQGDEFRFGIPSVAFSIDDKQILISNYADNFLRMLDATTGKQLKEIRGHKQKIAAISVAPNGKMFATGSLDRDIKLWNAATNKELKTLVGHTDFVFGLAFSNDSKRLLSGSYDRTARLWDVEAGKELSQLKGIRGPVQQSVFSHDGSLIAVAGTDASAGNEGVVRIYDATSGDYALSLRGHRTKVESVTFAPNGKLIATCSLDKTIRLWNPNSGGELLKLTQDAPVRCVMFSPDGKHLAAGCDDKSVKIWDVRSIAGVSVTAASATSKK